MMAAFIYEYTSKRQAAPRFGRATTNPDQQTSTSDPPDGSTFRCNAGQRFQPQTTFGGV